jgi:hypothetical protein
MQYRRFMIGIAAPLLAASALWAAGGSAAATSTPARPAAASVAPAVALAGAPDLGPNVSRSATTPRWPAWAPSPAT